VRRASVAPVPPQGSRAVPRVSAATRARASAAVPQRRPDRGRDNRGGRPDSRGGRPTVVEDVPIMEDAQAGRDSNAVPAAKA